MNDWDINQVRFAAPAALWAALVIVPALAAFLAWAGRVKQAQMRQFVHDRLLAALVTDYSPRRERLRRVLLVAAAALVLLALARPQWGYQWEEVRQRGLDVVVAIDTSRSMLAPDVAPNRLERARLACLDLLRQARTDRLGLVAFAGGAFLQCPLTLDEEAFRQSLSALDTRILPQGGTALADAIRTSLEAFNSGENNHRVLILLTDGEDQDTGAVAAAEEAARAGVKIFTVGVGTPGGELLSYVDEKGQRAYVRDERGEIVRSRLNEDLLRQIATQGQGFYLPLSGTQTMETLYRQGLEPLPKNEASSRHIRRYHERYQWLLALAAVLLAAEWLLQTLPSPRPAAGSPSASAGAPPAAVAGVLVLVGGLLPASASPRQAQRAFAAGDYPAALAEYQRLAQEKPGDPRLTFNSGTAAFRLGDYDTAWSCFDTALRTEDLALQQQAFYNRGNARYRQGEKTPDLEQRTRQWQEALADYERALQLQPQDTDAEFNRDLVKRKLAELEQQKQQQQQQQPQQQPPQQKNQPPPKPDQPDESSQPSDKQPEKKPGQEKSTEKPPDRGEDPGQSPAGEKPSPEQAAKDREQAKAQPPGQPPAPPSSGGAEPKQSADQSTKPGGEEAQMAAGAEGMMTPQQAKELLDSLKGEQKVLIFRPPGADKGKARSLRDW